MVRKIAEYPEHTAGKIDVNRLHNSLAASDQNRHLKKFRPVPGFTESLHHAIYVLDDKSSLIGGVTLRRLISAPQDIKISEIMSPVQLIKIRVTADQEDVAKTFSKYDLTAAPVVKR